MKTLKEPTPICKICFKNVASDNYHTFFTKDEICYACLMDLKPIFKSFKINEVKALAVYNYDEKIKQLIFRFKGCYDYELSSAFIKRYANELRICYLNYVIVPMPSYFLEDEERGFNHVVEIYKHLNIEMKKVLFKTKKHKQSDCSYEERKNIKDVLEVKSGEEITGKNILLVDDICTTGSSLKAAISLLEPFHPKKIKVLVMAKRDFSKEEKELLKDKIEILD